MTEQLVEMIRELIADVAIGTATVHGWRRVCGQRATVFGWNSCLSSKLFRSPVFCRLFGKKVLIKAVSHGSR